MMPCNKLLKLKPVWTTNDLWSKRPGAFFQQPKSLLIMDSARADTTNEADEALDGTNTKIKITDGV